MRNPKEFLSKRETANVTLTPRLRVFVNEYLNFKQLISEPINILDVGCGKNCLLSKYKEEEDKYYGCDFYDGINEKIDGYVSIDLSEEKLSDKYKGIKFDVIFCGEVLEHLFSPDFLLDEIGGLMHSNSVLILSTPNLAYLPNRLLLLLGISPLFLENSSEFKLGRKYKMFGQLNKTEGHIKVFTYGALVDLLRLKRYKIIKIISTPTPWNIFLDRIICKLSKGWAANNVFILKKL